MGAGPWHLGKTNQLKIQWNAGLTRLNSKTNSTPKHLKIDSSQTKNPQDPMNSTMRQRKVKKSTKHDTAWVPSGFTADLAIELASTRPGQGAVSKEYLVDSFLTFGRGQKNVIMIFNSEIVLINKSSIQLSEATCQHSFPVSGSKCGNKPLVCSELCK